MTKIFMVLINGCRWNSFSFWGYHQVAGAYPGETDIFRAYFRKLPRGTDYGLIIKDFAKNTSD